MKKNKLCILIIMSFLISGCCCGWSRTKGQFVNSSQRYSVDLPWGWMKFKSRELYLTKDGMWLERIVISRFNSKEKLAHTKKRFTEDMLPEEIAAVIIDDLNSDNDMGNLEVVENIPVKISGLRGFKLTYNFTDADGLNNRCVYYGCMKDKWIYKITYSAASWNYFDKEVSAFEELVKSFRFL